MCSIGVEGLMPFLYSLMNKDDATLENVLRDLSNFRRFQS